MPVVRMTVAVSGTRDGADWPPIGETIDVTAEEAEHLIAGGQAVARGDSIDDTDVSDLTAEQRHVPGRPVLIGDQPAIVDRVGTTARAVTTTHAAEAIAPLADAPDDTAPTDTTAVTTKNSGSTTSTAAAKNSAATKNSAAVPDVAGRDVATKATPAKAASTTKASTTKAATTTKASTTKSAKRS